MKKFVFTYFGITNFNEDWYGWRMGVLETFVMKSIENNAEKDLYWVIFINQDAPLSIKRKINSVIDNLYIRGNVYLTDIDFKVDIIEKSMTFSIYLFLITPIILYIFEK